MHTVRITSSEDVEYWNSVLGLIFLLFHLSQLSVKTKFDLLLRRIVFRMISSDSEASVKKFARESFADSAVNYFIVPLVGFGVRQKNHYAVRSITWTTEICVSGSSLA
jgi:hypothetical protein